MDLKRLQKISHRVNSDKSEVANKFLTGLKRHLASRGYRADLSITTTAKSIKGSFSAFVPFDAQLGNPSEEDLTSLVAQEYPTHEIDWRLVEVEQNDDGRGVVYMQLQPSVEIIPVSAINEIPPEFQPIGAGIYKRAVDSKVSEIWTLRKGDDGLVLSRNNDDLEVTADKNELRAGDVADTPYGPGKILKFDEYGNALVLVGNKRHLVAGKELGMYSIDREKKKLEDYYTQAYGDSAFAADLVKDYTERKKSK